MISYQDDYQNQNGPGTGNDQLGENTEQTSLASAVNSERHAENQGWDKSEQSIAAENENDQRVPTVTPGSDDGLTDSDDNLIDDNRINGAMNPQDAGYSPDEDGTDDDDLIDDDDDDLLDDDDDDDTELIPVETDDDDLDVDDDDDLDVADDDDEDEDLDPAADRPTTFEVDTDFAGRDHGRVTGTMLDHEPGLPGSGRI